MTDQQQQLCQSSERILKLFLDESVNNKSISLQLWFNKSSKLQFRLSTASSRRENRRTTAYTDESRHQLLTDRRKVARLNPSLLSQQGQQRLQTRSVKLLQLFLQCWRVQDLLLRRRPKFLDMPPSKVNTPCPS